MEGLPENQPLRPQERQDANIFDVLEFLAGLEDIDEKAIEDFRTGRIKNPVLKKTFESGKPEEKVILTAIDRLDPEKLEFLKKLMIGRDVSLPGIHHMQSVFSELSLLTEDPKYSIPKSKMDSGRGSPTS